jgi:conjugal transfer pilus assembly protein TraK
MPSVDTPGTVTAPTPLQVELPPVDASVLKAVNQQATSVAPQQLQVTPGINELIPIAVGHLNQLATHPVFPGETG